MVMSMCRAKQILGGHKQNLVHARIQEKEAVTPQETDQDLLGSDKESPAEVWVGGALSVAVHAWELLKELAIIFITSTIVWPPVNNREGTQLHPSPENWIKNLLSMTPPIRRRPSFPLSQSHQEVSISLSSFSIRGQAENHSPRKLTNVITWTTALSNSIKL